MHAKWLDAGVSLAAFHLQSKRYEKIQPPTFGAHPDIDLDSVVREREQSNAMTPEKLKVILSNASDEELDASFQHDEKGKPSLWKRIASARRRRKNIKKRESDATNITILASNNLRTKPSNKVSINSQKSVKSLAGSAFIRHSDSDHTPLNCRPRLSRLQSVANLSGGMMEDSPSLFLQEAAHLLSLLSAVAFTTLRNDAHKAPAPLAEYTVGSRWPSADPDADNDQNYYKLSWFVASINYLLGNVRSASQRTVYNSERPIRVLGGVSDAEIEMLQRARGPVAKTALCSMWLQEFYSREFENGSLGNTAPPIASRFYHYVGDGTLG